MNLYQVTFSDDTDIDKTILIVTDSQENLHKIAKTYAPKRSYVFKRFYGYTYREGMIYDGFYSAN